MLIRILCILLFIAPLTVQAQTLEGLASKYDDRVAEWVIFAYDEKQEQEIAGTLEMRWPLDNNWRIWDIRLEDYTSSIKVKWGEDPNHWELRGNQTIQIKSVWKNDANSWIISGSDHEFRLIANQTFDGLEWRVKGEESGYFGMIMEFEGDIRDWFIQDELFEDIPIDYKLAMMFVPLIRYISQ